MAGSLPYHHSPPVKGLKLKRAFSHPILVINQAQQVFLRARYPFCRVRTDCRAATSSVLLQQALQV
jgi:hypothetical protein